MPFPTNDIIGILADNLRIRNSVFPLSTKKAIRWAKGLDIPRGGETVIYTGSMYQLVPYIISMVKMSERFEDTFIGNFTYLGRFFNKYINVSRFMAWPSRRDIDVFNPIIRTIALLLKQAGINFGYLYELELYGGALVHDLGADDIFQNHAQKLYTTLKQNGVKSLITVDPHTLNIFRSVYPTFLNGGDIQVKSYLEVLVESDLPVKYEQNDELMIHDSCVYARHERIIEEPRTLLEKAGYRIREPHYSRELTHCCGGPIESLFPKTSHEISAKRIEQMKNGNGQQNNGTINVVTMCPICLASLKEVAIANIEVNDITLFLKKAYL